VEELAADPVRAVQILVELLAGSSFIVVGNVLLPVQFVLTVREGALI